MGPLGNLRADAPKADHPEGHARDPDVIEVVASPPMLALRINQAPKSPSEVEKHREGVLCNRLGMRTTRIRHRDTGICQAIASVDPLHTCAGRMDPLQPMCRPQLRPGQATAVDHIRVPDHINERGTRHLHNLNPRVRRA